MEAEGVLVALGAVLAVGIIVILCCATVVLAASIDNRLRILVGRDLRSFQALDVGGVSVADLVRQRAGPATWSAAHWDSLSDTDVECRLGDGRRCCWQVSHYRPRPWLPQQTIYFTPTNRAAAILIPELVPPGRMPAARFPEQAYRAGAIYDEAEPDKARTLFEPYFRMHHPKLFEDSPAAEPRRG